MAYTKIDDNTFSETVSVENKIIVSILESQFADLKSRLDAVKQQIKEAKKVGCLIHLTDDELK